MKNKKTETELRAVLLIKGFEGNILLPEILKN